MPPARPLLWTVLGLFLIAEGMLGLRWLDQLSTAGLAHTWTVLTEPVVLMTFLDSAVFALLILIWMYHDARLGRRLSFWVACLPLFLLTPTVGLIAYLLTMDDRRLAGSR